MPSRSRAGAAKRTLPPILLLLAILLPAASCLSEAAPASPAPPAGASSKAASRPAPALQGMALEARGPRIVVARVSPGSAAAGAGVLPGDVLLVVDDQALVDLVGVSPEDVLRIAAARKNEPVRLVIGRGAATLGITLPARGPGETATAQPEVAVGQPAPPITGRDLGGAAVSLEAQRGKPVIVDFWASWCPPCRDAALVLRRLAGQWGDRLAVIGVSLDQDPRAFEAFVYNQHLPGQQIHDGGPFGPIGTAYGVQAAGLPHAVLISPDGKVAAIGRTAADLEAAIGRLAGPPEAGQAPVP